MASPFTSLTCTVRHDGARLLVWTMLPGVSIPDRAGLRLESRLGGGDWEENVSQLKIENDLLKKAGSAAHQHPISNAKKADGDEDEEDES